MSAGGGPPDGPVRVVVVGASLGGLTAVRAVLAALPADFAPPTVIVQHRRADADSRLCEILAGACALPVIEPEDKETLRPSYVYVAPANYHLLVETEALWLSIDPPVLFARPAIDVLFESAADAFGAGVLGVVLTGSSEDGAAGARAIKRAHGTVLVQDPRTAESPVMPMAAIVGNSVDEVLPLAALGRRVVEIVQQRATLRAAPTRVSPAARS